MLFYIGLPNFIQIEPPTMEFSRHIDFEDGGHVIGNLLPALGVVMALA